MPAVNRPKGWYDFGADYAPEPRISIDIEEYGPREIDTGLLDADGNSIMRREQRRPVWFWRVEDQEQNSASR